MTCLFSPLHKVYRLGGFYSYLFKTGLGKLSNLSPFPWQSSGIILYLLTYLGAVLPAVPGVTSHRGRRCSAFPGWKNTPHTPSCVLILSLLRCSLDHISSWCCLVLLIHDEPSIFFAQISKLLKGTTRKVPLFTLSAACQSSGAAVATGSSRQAQLK